MEQTILDAIKKLQVDLSSNINDLRKDLKDFSTHTEAKFEKHEEILNKHEVKLFNNEKEYRKKNLIISGIPESEKSMEELEELLLNFLNNTMKIQTVITEIDHVRRIGIKAQGKHRPIQVRLIAYRKIIKILTNRKNLQNTNYNIWEDLPKEIVSERKSLVPIMRKFRQQGQHAIIKYNKLYVDGKMLSQEEIAKDIKKRQLSEDMEEIAQKQKQAKQTGTIPKEQIAHKPKQARQTSAAFKENTTLNQTDSNNKQSMEPKENLRKFFQRAATNTILQKPELQEDNPI